MRCVATSEVLGQHKAFLREKPVFLTLLIRINGRRLSHYAFTCIGRQNGLVDLG